MGDFTSMEGRMARKWMTALVAVAAIGLVQPTAALARGGHGGGGGGGMSGHGGMGGGGYHGGMGGGSFHSAGMMHSSFGGGGFRAFHGGFRDHDRFRDHDHDRFHRRAFVGFGFGSYGYDDYPYYYDDGCYTVRHRVLTRYGWRIRPVQVCG
jgi:hypothetical protein